MFDPKIANKALVEKNKNIVKKLYQNQNEIVVTAEWDNKFAVNQETQVDNREAQFAMLIQNFNQNCEAMEEGFDNIPWITFFDDISWLMSIAYGCSMLRVNGIINSSPLFYDEEDLTTLIRRSNIYQYGLYPLVSERINEFQVRYGNLPINIPDNQSPIDVTTQIVHSETAMIGMFTAPDAIHHVLGLVTDAIIELNKYLKSIILNFGSYQPRRYLPFGMHFSEDDAAFLSPDLYKKFVTPYDEKIAAEFGGLAFHCCMGQEQNLQNVTATKGFLSFDAMPDYNSMDKILDAVSGRGVWNVYNYPWSTTEDRGEAWFQNIIDRSRGRCSLYLNVHRQDKDDALRLATRVKEYAMKGPV